MISNSQPSRMDRRTATTIFPLVDSSMTLPFLRFILLGSRRTLFLFINSAQRELVSICTQRRVYETAINFPYITTLPRGTHRSPENQPIWSSRLASYSYNTG